MKFPLYQMALAASLLSALIQPLHTAHAAGALAEEGETPEQVTQRPVVATQLTDAEIKQMRDRIAQLEKQAEEEAKNREKNQSTQESREEVSDEDKKDEKYERTFARLSCQSETDSYEKAHCLTLNLQEIMSRATSDRRYKNLLIQARTILRRELADTYKITSKDELPEASDRFDMLADAIKMAGDRNLGTNFDTLKRELIQATTNSFEAQEINEQFQTETRVALRDAKVQYDRAIRSNEPMAIDMAERRLLGALRMGQSQLGQLENLDPKYNIEMIQDIMPGASVTHLTSSFDQAIKSVQRQLGLYQDVIQSPSYSMDPVTGEMRPIVRDQNSQFPNRMARNPGFSSLDGMFQYGQNFSMDQSYMIQNGNFGVNDPNSFSRAMDTNNNGFSASQFLSQNPNLMTGGRGRGF